MVFIRIIIPHKGEKNPLIENLNITIIDILLRSIKLEELYVISKYTRNSDKVV